MDERHEELLRTLHEAILEAESIRRHAEAKKELWMVDAAIMTLENLRVLESKVEKGQARFGAGYGFSRGVGEWGGTHLVCDRLCNLADKIDELCRKLG